MNRFFKTEVCFLTLAVLFLISTTSAAQSKERTHPGWSLRPSSPSIRGEPKKIPGLLNQEQASAKKKLILKKELAPYISPKIILLDEGQYLPLGEENVKVGLTKNGKTVVKLKKEFLESKEIIVMKDGRGITIDFPQTTISEELLRRLGIIFEEDGIAIVGQFPNFSVGENDFIDLGEIISALTGIRNAELPNPDTQNAETP